MELDDLKNEWNQSGKVSENFSKAQLKLQSTVDKLIKAQSTQFIKMLMVSLIVVMTGAVFLTPADGEGYQSIVIMILGCSAITVPICATYIKATKTLKSLDVSAHVARSLQDYKNRVEVSIKIQKLVLLFVIVILLVISFLIPLISLDGFNITAAIGIYTLILLGYSYRNMERVIVKELNSVSMQYREFMER